MGLVQLTRSSFQNERHCLANRNPYGPPASLESTGPLPPEPRTPAPGSVWRGVGLYILSFVLFFVLAVVMAPATVTIPARVSGGPVPAAPPESELMVIGVAVVALMLGAPAWLLFKVTRRRHWARVTLAFVSALAFAFFALYPVQVLPSHPAQTAAFFANGALEGVALALLFTPNANRWFRSAPEY